MSDTPPTPGWDPGSPEVQIDPIQACDQQRRECPVARSRFLHCSLLSREAVLAVLNDHRPSPVDCGG
jgi:hypothetical protein